MTCERCQRPIHEGASPCMLLFLDRMPPTHFFCSLTCIDMWLMKPGADGLKRMGIAMREGMDKYKDPKVQS